MLKKDHRQELIDVFLLEWKGQQIECIIPLGYPKLENFQTAMSPNPGRTRVNLERVKQQNKTDKSIPGNHEDKDVFHNFKL